MNSLELKRNVDGINGWIGENQSKIGNANMYEIMDQMLKRNLLREVEGPNEELDASIERMIELRNQSITEFQSIVPESKASFEAVRNGLLVESEEEKNLLCKIQSIAFFIYNSRKRGFGGDIMMEQEDQEFLAKPDFKHDNREEVISLVNAYNKASDEVKKVAYPLCNWVVKNSIQRIQDIVEEICPLVKPASDTDNYSL